MKGRKEAVCVLKSEKGCALQFNSSLTAIQCSVLGANSWQDHIKEEHAGPCFAVVVCCFLKGRPLKVRLDCRTGMTEKGIFRSKGYEFQAVSLFRSPPTRLFSVQRERTKSAFSCRTWIDIGFRYDFKNPILKNEQVKNTNVIKECLCFPF